ncbi:MAG: type II toxin-antitoxin system Phd/YefM family antitoxin [Pseudonocardia sp.]
MSYSESRARYTEAVESVVYDREEVIIAQAGHEPVVIVFLDDYQSPSRRSLTWSAARRTRADCSPRSTGSSQAGSVHDLVE